MRFNNYHKHTHYSNISTPDCIIKPLDYAKRAVELGHTTICTTEHGYAGNVFEYYDVAKKHDLKLIFAVEYYYVNDRLQKDRSNSHLMILAKNNEGKRELTKLITESNKTGYFYKPRIDKELVLSLNPNNVVVTSTCVMSYVGKNDDYEEAFIKPFLNHFKDNFYLEIHDNTHPMQVSYNLKILDLHKRYGIPLIHACDSHYIYPEQDRDRTEFLNGKNIYYPEEEGFILDYPDSDAIFERYQEQGVFSHEQVEESLKNTLILDDFEDITMDKEIKMPSIYPNFTHEQKMEKLKQIITEEWLKDREEIPKREHKKYLDAIRFETKIIEDTKMEDYFLLNYEVIKRAKEKGGILTRTGRGSSPSYYINKLLGFTEIDRVSAPITLYPTRFISTSRILETKSLPDIDFNTAQPEPFIESANEILGEDNVYYMTAYGTMQASEAFRNICRARNLRMEEYNEVGKDLESYANHEKWGALIKESEKFIDVIDSVSPHPCAFLLYSKPISEDIGVIRIANTAAKKITYCALIDSDTSDAWKYLKNDFLTVTVWQIISETYRVINKPIPNIRELSALIENDDKVWDLYEKGLTITLNQTGTDSGIPQVMKYKPKSVRELSAWVSAIRPSFASMKHVFLDRQPFSYGIPEFDAILQESDNFILFQENIMRVLVYSGFPEDETYGLLKAIAKKKEGIIEPIYERFINGFVAKTGSKENAEKVWKIIEDAVGYGFNSSHALSVALDSLYGAYLKANYPLEYFTVVLNKYDGDTKTTNKIVGELKSFDITIKPIKFGKSLSSYAMSKDDNSIYKGLKSIKFLNEKIGEELYSLSTNKYKTFVDLLIDIKEHCSVNTKQMDILIKLGFFSEFGDSGKLLVIWRELSDGKNKYDKKHKPATKEKRIKLLYMVEESNESVDISIQEQITFEKEHLGYVETTFPDEDFDNAIILEINTKYKPVIFLYRLQTGEQLRFKAEKHDFYKNNKDTLFVGDIIKIGNVENKNRMKNVDGAWVAMDETEPYMKSCKIVRRAAQVS